jgi:DNA ligase (NAD+)
MDFAASGVSRDTDFLVAGEKTGKKLNEAKNISVKVLTEKEFKKIIKSKS